ncbi:hypothetical protein C8R43DRAFT_708830 [Mycena crocata]|nr:hypothetical protein C8R43DRAFT_708830 [Mycena crocata]
MQDRVLQADVLYHLARATLTSDSGPECERLCKEALLLYEETGNVDGRAECTWLLGQIYKGGERQKESKGLYEQALALATESQNRYCQGKCLLCLSEMSFHAGDAATAELVGQQALQLFREVENLMNVGMALAWLGRLAIFRNDGTAEATLDEAAEVFKQAGAPYQLGRILLGKGDSAIARCDFHAAREAYTKAVALHQETGSLKSNLGAFAQVSLGTATAYLYDYAEARRWLDAASRTFEKTKTNVAAYGKLHCDMIRGDLGLYEENFEEALTLYQRALLAAESRGFQEEEALCRVKIGTMAFLRGHPQEGLQHLFVAAAIQRRISDVKGLSQTLVRLGRCFEAAGDKNTAVLLFQTAYPLCRKMEGLRDVADCLLGLGTLFKNTEQVMEAAALYRKTGDTKGLYRCTAALATM